MNYVFHLSVMLCIYLMLTFSLNVLVGYTGLLSMAHAAFYAFGAYASALLLLRMDCGFVMALSISAVLSIAVAFVLGVLTLRLKGDYFLLGTLGLQVVAFSCASNFDTLTGGPLGLPGIPRPSLMGFRSVSSGSYAILAGLFATGTIVGLALLLRSPFGRALRAIREDELAALALGINVWRTKVAAFLVASAVAAAAGALYGSYVTFIDPTSASVAESIFVLSAVLVGGSGNLTGPAVGAVLMVLLPEALRFVQLPDNVVANMRQVLYGLMLIILMRIRSQGIAGDYALDR